MINTAGLSRIGKFLMRQAVIWVVIALLWSANFLGFFRFIGLNNIVVDDGSCNAGACLPMVVTADRVAELISFYAIIILAVVSVSYWAIHWIKSARIYLKEKIKNA